MPLTDTAVRNLKPQEKPFKKTDGGGMYLHVLPTGAKYWRLAYRLDGVQRTFAIGVYPEVSLAEARERRDAAKKLVREGIDPVSHRTELAQRRQAEKLNSFEAVGREWHEAQKGRWSEKHAAKVLASLERDLFPAIGNKAVVTIKPTEVLAAVRKVEGREAYEIAHRVLQRCGAVFQFAIATGKAEINPAAGLSKALKAPVTTHHAALSEADLPEFLTRLAAYDGDVQTRLAIQLMLLTFVRTSELREAEWSEFDLDAAEWRIPAHRMKMREPLIVPLARQAIAILNELRALTGCANFVFPSRNGKRQPMSNNTVLFALYRMGYRGRATGHGFRTTASTILNERGYNADWIERQLSHSPRDRVRAAYNRAQYLNERRNMMQAWADLIDEFGCKGMKSNRLNAAEPVGSDLKPVALLSAR